MNSLYYKKYIDKLINSNPVEIKINKQIKTSDNYGGFTTKTITVVEKAMLYDTRARREVVTDYGKTYTGVSITKLLAKGDSEIKKGDTFTLEDVKYKVFSVNDFEPICKQIELEVIGNG